VAQDALAQLAATIRAELHAALEAGCSVLHHVMNAGDALNTAQAKVESSWKPWLKENCLLSVRTALVYQRLARHRNEIEARMAEGVHLSIRGALSLIREGNSGDDDGAADGAGDGEGQAPSPPAETLAAHWKRESKPAQTAALDEIGADGILKAASPEFCARLRDRFVGVLVAQNPKLKKSLAPKAGNNVVPLRPH
jgi:hypothetical protein